MSYLETGKQVIKELKANGYEAYFVGGFVRDRLLGHVSDDIDITTSATPEQVTSVFPVVKQTGVKYGTVTVIIDDYKYEVTTFRVDGAYLDHRRPDDVSFSTKLEDDLSRRDFTINAFVMDEEEQVVDLFYGQDDLKNKVIRTIGDPLLRFTEDGLRILRSFRFVSKLGFEIEENTKAAIVALKETIKHLAIERIMIELDKIMRGAHRQKAFQYMVETGVHEQLFGLQEGLKYLSTHEVDLYPLEMFALCFVLGEEQDVWRFSNKDYRLIQQVLYLHEATKEESFNKFILFSNGLEACMVSNRVSVALGYADQEALIKQLDAELLVKDVCDLKFKGQDILQCTTLKKRSIIALVIDELLYNVIMEILPNEYNVLKEFALQKIDELQKDMERE